MLIEVVGARKDWKNTDVWERNGAQEKHGSPGTLLGKERLVLTVVGKHVTLVTDGRNRIHHKHGRYTTFPTFTLLAFDDFYFQLINMYIKNFIHLI